MDKDLIYRMLLVSGTLMLGCAILYLLIDLAIAILYFMLTSPLYALGWLCVIYASMYFIFKWKDGRF